MGKEILVNVVVDYGFFSLTESVLFYLCFLYIGSLNKMKWYQIVIMGLGNAFISQAFPAVIYQVIMILWMSLLLKNNNKTEVFLKCLKAPIFAMTMFFILEVAYSIFLEYFLNFEGLKILNINEKFYLFILMIPIRIIEILLILVVKNKKR